MVVFTVTECDFSTGFWAVAEAGRRARATSITNGIRFLRIGDVPPLDVSGVPEPYTTPPSSAAVRDTRSLCQNGGRHAWTGSHDQPPRVAPAFPCAHAGRRCSAGPRGLHRRRPPHISGLRRGGVRARRIG